MIKRMLAVLVSVSMLFSLSACSKKSSDSNDSNSPKTSSSTNSSDAEYADKLFSKDVLKIEITTTDDDWSNLIENAGSKPWISGDISIDGETFENVGIKTKGNTSLNQVVSSDSDRYSLKINFGKYVDDQTCYGLDKLVLNNIYADSTYLKEYMSYNLFAYMDVPSSMCTFAEISVNGEHYGFYIAIEDPNDSFLARNYGDDNSVEAYKPDSMNMGGDGDNARGQDQNQNGMQGGNMPNMDITKLVTITDKDGNQVNWTDLSDDFDFENIESFITSDDKETKLSDLDMQSMMSLDLSDVATVKDTNGKTIDLSKYTLSMQNFGGPQGGNGGQMPQQNMDGVDSTGSSDGTNSMSEPPEMPSDMSSADNGGQMDGQMPMGGFGGNQDDAQGGQNGVSLVYSDDNADSYSSIFDNSITKIDDEDKSRLIASLKAISEGENIEDYIDVDEVLRYTACNVFLVNLDSYFSSMAHNYILAENDGVLSMLPWDYNLSFGTYQSGSSSSAINYAIDTVFSGIDAEQRPIISKLLENEEYNKKYHEYLKQIAEEYIQGGIFEKTIEKVDSAINEYVKNDTTTFYSYDEYTAGIEELKKFGTLRAESVLGQLDGTIPSTTEEQTNSDKLVDASSLDLSKLGSMGGGPSADGAKPSRKVYWLW